MTARRAPSAVPSPGPWPGRTQLPAPPAEDPSLVPSLPQQKPTVGVRDSTPRSQPGPRCPRSRPRRACDIAGQTRSGPPRLRLWPDRSGSSNLPAVDSLPAISPRLALMIGGVAAVLFGLVLLVFPSSALSAAGLAVPTEATVVARDVGATLIGLGLIN